LPRPIKLNRPVARRHLREASVSRQDVFSESIGAIGKLSVLGVMVVGEDNAKT